jgi:predicted RNA-binding Zn ribbon-like protein
MKNLPWIPHQWVVLLINEYGEEPRRMASESSQPFPAIPAAWPPDVAQLPSVADLQTVASTLWTVFAGTSEDQRAQRLNAILEQVDLQPRLDSTGRLTWVRPETSRRDLLLLAACAATLVDAVTRFGWKRLGVCAGRDCGDVFIDESGRRLRSYCSGTCLNRARVRAYRSRSSDTK